MSINIRKVLIPDPVHKSCEELLTINGFEVISKQNLTKEQLIEELKDVQALIIRSETTVTGDIIEKCDGLQVIGRAGTGVDNIDCEAATKKGILVYNSPNGNTISAAEHTCAMIMSLARNVPQACSALKQRQWKKKENVGFELQNKTLAILGMGRIGREVAHRMNAFGMNVLGFDPFLSKEAGKEIGVEMLSLESIWPRADMITVHTPLTPETKNLINKDVFAKCKKGVKVINVARGGIISEEDLIEALESGQCGGAALDVYIEEPPKSSYYDRLLTHQRVVCTPHLGASTKDAQEKIGADMAKQLIDLNRGKPMPGLINAPHMLRELSSDDKSSIDLACSLGKIFQSLFPITSSSPTELKITPIGDGWSNTTILIPSLLKGLINSAEVNLVNAAILSKAKQINASLRTQTQLEPTTTKEKTLEISLENGQLKAQVIGKILGEAPTLLKINNCEFQNGLTLSGNTIFFKGKQEQSGLFSLLTLLNSANASVSMVTSATSPNKKEEPVWYVARTHDQVNFRNVAESNGLKLVAQCHF